ncbi:MAG TPA: hypothetical protein VLI04_21580 [Nocardioidaceae bacterium]|nr:hypothetical protein [Nocardioidaceae bacterium]
MELRRVHVSTQLATHGLEPELLWDLVQRATVGPDDDVTAALAPYFLDTETNGRRSTWRSGMRRDVEQTATSVKVTLTRWVECPSGQASRYERRYDRELASQLKELRVAVGSLRAGSVSRRA